MESFGAIAVVGTAGQVGVSRSRVDFKGSLFGAHRGSWTVLLVYFVFLFRFDFLLVAQTTATTFTQSGTGAVSRPLAAKLGDIVNVKDFGALCDDLTDDQVAIDLAISSGHHGIEFPEGVCHYGNTSSVGTYSMLTNLGIFSSGRTIISFLNNGSGSGGGNGLGWTFDSVTNLTIQGLTFRYQTPPTMRTTVVCRWL